MTSFLSSASLGRYSDAPVSVGLGLTDAVRRPFRSCAPQIDRANWGGRMPRPSPSRTAFPTGDLAKRDGDGYYCIVDRRRKSTIRGGHDVHPREVEEALFEHPAVAEVAVGGIGTRTWARRSAARSPQSFRVVRALLDLGVEIAVVKRHEDRREPFHEDELHGEVTDARLNR